MADSFKSFEPKAGVDESLTVDVVLPPVEVVDEEGRVTLDRREGEPVTIAEWPHTAASSQEERLLDNHPLLKRVSAAKAQKAKASDKGEDS